MTGIIEDGIKQMMESGEAHSAATHDETAQATTPADLFGVLPEAQTQPSAEAPTPEPAPEQTDEEVPAHEQEMTGEERAKKLARDLREARRRIARQEQEIAVHRGQRTETIDEQTRRLIEQGATEKAQIDAVNEKCNVIFNQGVKAYGRSEFQDAVQTMNEAFGQRLPLVLETLVDLPDPEKLIAHLADNPDSLDDLVSLAPHKLGAALAREAVKLATPKVKQISKAPAPVKPLSTRSGSTGSGAVALEDMPMEQFAQEFEARMRGRR